MRYVIGVDLGTSGRKTVLFDEKGTVIASMTIEYPMYQPKNGYAEQDPADWYNAAVNTIKGVIAKSGVSFLCERMIDTFDDALAFILNR